MAEQREIDEHIPVTPITAERYVSHDYLAREWQRLWPKMWLVAGL